MQVARQIQRLGEIFHPLTGKLLFVKITRVVSAWIYLIEITFANFTRIHPVLSFGEI